MNRLPPLCELDLPINALVGYRDAQLGVRVNPFAPESSAAREWMQGYELAVQESAAAMAIRE